MMCGTHLTHNRKLNLTANIKGSEGWVGYIKV